MSALHYGLARALLPMLPDPDESDRQSHICTRAIEPFKLLGMAVRHGSLEVFEHVQADLSAASTKWPKIVCLAAGRGRTEFMEWLQAHGQLPGPGHAGAKQMITAAIRGDQAAVISWILRHEFTLTDRQLQHIMQYINGQPESFYMSCLRATVPCEKGKSC